MMLSASRAARLVSRPLAVIPSAPVVVVSAASAAASILVLGEANGGTISRSVYPCIAAAQEIHDADGSSMAETHLLVAGVDGAAAGDAAVSASGIGKVLSVAHSSLGEPIPERLAAVLKSVVDSGAYSHVLAAATVMGSTVLPRVAAQLDVAPISSITGVKAPRTFERLIYAGNAITTVETSAEAPFVAATVRGTAFDGRPFEVEGKTGAVEVVTVAPDVEALSAVQDLSTFVGQEVASGDRPSLTDANVVISGGRGLKNGENFALLDALGEPLGAAIGASRAVVDAGFVPNSYQVGQTGKVVAPELYIAVGISGAIQHLAGMKDAKVIAAINTDAEAPIFKVADVGIVKDLFEVVPEVTEILKASKK